MRRFVAGGIAVFVAACGGAPFGYVIGPPDAGEATSVLGAIATDPPDAAPDVLDEPLPFVLSEASGSSSSSSGGASSGGEHPDSGGGSSSSGGSSSGIADAASCLSTCSGCCDYSGGPAGVCRGGASDAICGVGGWGCADCTAMGQACQAGNCVNPPNPCSTCKPCIIGAVSMCSASTGCQCCFSGAGCQPN